MKGENNLFYVPEERWQLPRRTLLERLLAVSSAGLLLGKSASRLPSALCSRRGRNSRTILAAH